MDYYARAEIRRIVDSLDRAAELLLDLRDRKGMTGEDESDINQAINRVTNAVDDLRDVTTGVPHA